VGIIRVSLESLMKWIGSYGAGCHILVRYDPLREKNNFTIVIDRERLCDTDDPVEELMDWYKERV
jgi:hypothetical protein